MTVMPVMFTDRADPFTVTGETWMQGASCATTDPEIFFPDGRGSTTRPARRICATCDVIEECAEFAVRTRQDIGVWGGMSRAELRRRIKETNP